MRPSLLDEVELAALVPAAELGGDGTGIDAAAETLAEAAVDLARDLGGVGSTA